MYEDKKKWDCILSDYVVLVSGAFLREEQDKCMLNSNEFAKSFRIILPVKLCSAFLASACIACGEDYFKGGSMETSATLDGEMVLTGR
jgi:hypothetical protein